MLINIFLSFQLVSQQHVMEQTLLKTKSNGFKQVGGSSVTSS